MVLEQEGDFASANGFASADDSRVPGEDVARMFADCREPVALRRQVFVLAEQVGFPWVELPAKAPLQGDRGSWVSVLSCAREEHLNELLEALKSTTTRQGYD